MGKKSLAEQIAELSAPKNDFDIENSELADPFGGSDQDANDSLGLDNEAAQREHYVAMPKSRLRRENPLVEDRKYTGRLTDRKALYEDSETGASGSESAGELGLESGEDAPDLETGPESEAGSDGPESGSESSSESGPESGSESGLESGSESGSESSPESGPDEAQRSRQKDKIRRMMASERKHIVSRLSQSAASDALKGYSILQQHKEFDALIDSRLKVQKAVASANMLPASKLQLAGLADAPADVQARLGGAVDACYDLLDTIGALRSALLRREQLAVPDGAEKTPRKRSLAQYVARSSQQDAVLAQYRSSVLTKWLAKIQNSSGSSAMNAHKFKALNQSAEQQVLNNLQDMERLVKRTRLNRRKISPLGHVPEDAGNSGAGGAAHDDADALLHTQTRAMNMQEMPQIFDDDDFYRVLLNDLVDKKIQSSDPTSGLQFALRGAASTKLKKSVDSKASKGRKLRFHVQEPIANFDTPRQWLQWNDDQIDEFFASLLGQKISMKEDDGDSAGDDSADEQLVGADSIQLFG